MKGVASIPLRVHADSRGSLVAPREQGLPFEVRNYFYICNVPPLESRGEHSSCSHEALVVMQGSLIVDLDNGEEQQSLLLSPAKNVLCVHAGVHLKLHTFEPGTILFVMASQPYDPASRRNSPQLSLLDNGWESLQP